MVSSGNDRAEMQATAEIAEAQSVLSPILSSWFGEDSFSCKKYHYRKILNGRKVGKRYEILVNWEPT